MATTRQEFVDLANELFAEFEDFQENYTIEKISGVDFATKTYDSVSQIVSLIKFDKKKSSFAPVSGQMSESAGTEFIGLYANFDWIPQAEGAKISSESGNKYLIKEVIVDPANASVTMYCSEI